MGREKSALESLKESLERREKRTILNYEDYLELVKKEPRKVLRSIFQQFHDMVKSYVGDGVDEYPDDPESIGFIRYDCSKLFAEGVDNPFFADRLFANRFVRHVESLRQGLQQNCMHIFEGPHGCGKSTFFNNLLRKFEEYTDTKEGQTYELFWVLDENLLSSSKNGSESCSKVCSQKVEVPCPSHDHPILLIPKNYRPDFLNKLLKGDDLAEIRHLIFNEKEYEWIFKEEVCTICKTLFYALFDKLGSLDQVLNMVKARVFKFDRRLGEGITVFNPGDKPTMREPYYTDKQIQGKLDAIFGSSLVKYVFSLHAKTNNGIYSLMDVKGHNKERFLELHNVISEGVHKVADVEEKIESLFVALMNPEDKDIIKEAKVESFEGRIITIKVPYVLEVPTEVQIYRTIFGEHIGLSFLPRVLENFARVIIASRMNAASQVLKDWVKDVSVYKKFCDKDGLLLRMAIYSGVIPTWLSEEHAQAFTKQVRQKLITEAESEGQKGFSGRDAIRYFGDFFSRFGTKEKLISMENIVDFFKHKIPSDLRDKFIPASFIDSLVNWYDYIVLGEVKESLYFYNNEQIKEDILHFIYSVNYEIGHKGKCYFDGKEVEITTDFLKMIGTYITGRQLTDSTSVDFAKMIHKKYTQVTVQEMAGPNGKAITETELYKELFNSYVRSLKERVLIPFLANDNFEEAVKCFGEEKFKTFDTRLKDHVTFMIKNLTGKFGYTQQGAKEICLYVLDKQLAKKFA